jgi:putative ABC transport system substrate-binding protein
MRRIGILANLSGDDPEARSRLAIFTKTLHRLGLSLGRNVEIDYRSVTAEADQMQALATELVALAPDVLLGVGSRVTLALQQATRSIPIVFVQVADPVFAGFVSNLIRPNSNITGFSNFRSVMGAKLLDLLKACAPHVDNVMMVADRTSPSWFPYFRAIEAASFGARLMPGGVSDAGEIERAINAVVAAQNGGLVVIPSNVTIANHELIIGLAARHRLPAVYASRFFADNGGLMSYGVDAADLYRGAASYIDQILHGAKPADLPVQLPTKFDLTINLKTAKAVGLEIPSTLLAEADGVIE